MGNEEGGSSFQKLVCSLLDQLLGFGVNGGGCLIQNEDGGVRKNCPGKRKELLLSCGKTVAALSYIAVIALIQFLGNLIRMYCPAAAFTSSSVASSLP